jgi:hypothetical protein
MDCKPKLYYDPFSMTALAIAVGVSGAATAGATAYSAAKESSAAKKAAEAQKAVGLAQIEAPLKAEQLAADTAQAKLKLKQASKTQSILTAPGDLMAADTTQKSILGV